MLFRSVITYELKQPTHQHERAVLNAGLRGLAPSGVCIATDIATSTGGLLHHRFTLTNIAIGGLLSVALSRGLLRVGVTHHLALRSPDFPRRTKVN